jgi:2-oxoglutarate ferredoxin oxidoreductase subunit beta
MGDGDCCSIGTAHWIHAIRYNMNLTVIVHDNQVYGLTKMQASPTSPVGLHTNTTPHGAILEPLKMLSTTLGVSNVSFVANAVEWIPQSLNDIIRKAYHHKGFSFIRVIQRCPAYLPHLFDPVITHPDSILFLSHKNGIQIPAELAKLYKNVEEHDPANLNRAREIAEQDEKIPIGILYQNENVKCYDEIRRPKKHFSAEEVEKILEKEFDKFSTNPFNGDVTENDERNHNEF